MYRKTLKLLNDNRSTLDKISDKATLFVGSWKFIITESFLIILWISFNTYQLNLKVDPYPFVFLNLLLAFISVLTMPFILMSQNREEQRDRIRDDADYEADMKSEEYVAKISKDVDDLKKELLEIKTLLVKKNTIV
ncbi:MAG: DUF1003 domain-containing protein [bacterium]